MKTKKMLKRLNKVEGLLSDVIDGLLTSQDSLERLLGAAKANVAEVVSQLEHGEGSQEALPRTGSAPGGLSQEGRKRISEAAKKRWAAAKRKGVNAVTGRRLQQTA